MCIDGRVNFVSSRSTARRSPWWCGQRLTAPPPTTARTVPTTSSCERMPGKQLSLTQREFIIKCSRRGWQWKDIKEAAEMMSPSRSRRISKTTIFRVAATSLQSARKSVRKGPPKYFNKARMDKLINTARSAIQSSNAEVTRESLRRKCNFTCSLSTISRALASRGYRWRSVSRKVHLTRKDRETRFSWADRYKRYSASWWLKNVVAFIDEKRWPAPLTPSAKKVASNMKVRGVYRRSWEGTKFSKPAAGKHASPGMVALQSCGGIGRRGAVIWRVPHKCTSKEFCAALSPLRRYSVASRRILLDNHKSHTSGLARQFMKHKKVKPIYLPPRSPDLMPLDFAGWQMIESRMAPSTARETKEQFCKRLHSAANSLTRHDVLSILQGFVKRIRAVAENAGGHYNECA